MRKIRSSTFYIALIAVFTAAMYWIVLQGASLEIGRAIIVPETDRSHWQEFVHSISLNLHHPLAILLAQIVTIIFAARVFGWMFKKMGQPTVIGEIIAGIVLGPSLIGTYFPEFSALLFPVASLGNLQFLSQIGLILFMYVVGMELELKFLKNKAHDAVVISHASIIIPFALGMGLAYAIYPFFAPENVQFSSFALFLGIAMSITAFPVLARIVQERGLHKSRLGTLVITCAAADDITAWCLLAGVIAIVKAGSFVSALYIIALAILYVMAMLYVVRPFLSRIGNLYQTKESLNKPIVAIFFLTLMLSAYTTEVIGIHALFGAFMAGAIMPENVNFRRIFIEKVEDVALVLLLPLFFVFTGLRTEIGLLNDPFLWMVTGVIILVAVIGKFVGSAVAAKFMGQNWRDSLTIGALMNTRGLMELVVLNIGYDLGILTPEIFAMMVIMALVTTFMTGPALDLIHRIFPSDETEPVKASTPPNKFKVLVSFGNPERGRSLLRLSNGFIRKQNPKAAVTAMHLSPTNELHHFSAAEYEKASFAPIIDESKRLKQTITTLFKASNDFESDITEVANQGDYDLLLIGLGQSIFEGSLLGNILGFTTRIINPEKLLNQVTGKESLFENSPFDERTRALLNGSNVPVGVLIDKEFSNLDAVFIHCISENDRFLIPYIQKLIANSGSAITIYDPNRILATQPELIQHVQFVEEKDLDSSFFKAQSLMMVSIDSWRIVVDSNHGWLSEIPSTLILKPGR